MVFNDTVGIYVLMDEASAGSFHRQKASHGARSVGLLSRAVRFVRAVQESRSTCITHHQEGFTHAPSISGDSGSPGRYRPASRTESRRRAPAPTKFRPLIQASIERQISSLDSLYKYLHTHPELSFEEEHTAARMGKELRAAGFEVTTKVGGHGVVGVLKNGAGPTVLVRTDMDALPVTEATGLPYASTVRTRDKDGKEVGVMHACGHDMHMTCWVGTARTLANMKSQWHGTLVFIAQPAEEVGGGARRMLLDGLFKRFPRPDFCLGLHCDPRQPYGHIAYAEGLLCANVDTVDITVRGKGGHGSAPQTTIDPIVLAARIVLDLQTLVSRETNPADPAVVTVGSIHGGTKHNIIPAEVKLQLTVRTLKDEVRQHILEGIQRIAKAAAQESAGTRTDHSHRA